MYLPHVGGQEVRYAEMAEALVAMGHSVDVYCIQCPPNTRPEEVLNGVNIHRRFPSPKYEEPFLKFFKRQPGRVIRYALWCREVVRKGNFDVLICNQWPLAHIVSLPRGKRQCAVIDWCEIRHSFPFPFFQRVLPQFVNSNMGVSPAVAEQISKASGKLVRYTPSGVHVERYLSTAAEQRKDILYVGRITEHKNLELLVDAFVQLRADGFAGRLLIGGTGPQLASLQQYVLSKEVNRGVVLLGHVSEQQKIDLLSKAAVFVIPSRREGFPRVVAEAMASRLPVATVDYPENGTKDVVEQYGLGVVSAPTPEALGDAIRTILNNWEEYSSNAAKFSHELDWAHVLHNMLTNLQFQGATV